LRGAAAAAPAADGDNPAPENETQLGQARNGPAPDQLDPESYLLSDHRAC